MRGNQRERRNYLRKLYGGVEVDGEEVVEVPCPPIEPILPKPVEKAKYPLVKLAGWPMDAQEAVRRQSAGQQASWTIDLGSGERLELVRIPAGSYVMGDPDGAPDEAPPCEVRIERSFWMLKCEITNAQYALFDPSHDSRFEDRTSWIFSEEYLGWPLDGPRQPVVRVSWQRAMQFCDWLSEKTGLHFTLPTEAEWEYACRAGTATPMWYGGPDADFSQVANVADYTIRNLAYEGWRPKSPDLAPRDARFNDGKLVTADVGSYRPNPWGLHDMHGNAAEWTRTTYRPFPYREDDGRNLFNAEDEKVVRGGSWYDRPQRCRSSFRLSYPAWQRVYNVGFRVVCQSEGERIALSPD